MQPRIFEVGPRDGLQNEKVHIPLDVKEQYVQLLVLSGLKDIEAGALSLRKPFLKWLIQKNFSLN